MTSAKNVVIKRIMSHSINKRGIDMRKALTKTQKRVFSIIEEDPSRCLADIAKLMNLSSVSNIHVHVQNLIKKGYLEKDGRTVKRVVNKEPLFPFDITSMFFSPELIQVLETTFCNVEQNTKRLDRLELLIKGG
jgi:SOS-response transcriptional repressor LexA